MIDSFFKYARVRPSSVLWYYYAIAMLQQIKYGSVWYGMVPTNARTTHSLYIQKIE